MRPTAALSALACALSLAAAARADDIDYKKLYAKVAPGVVLIYGEEGEIGSVGSGSIIREDGLVITNAHVILNHATQNPFPKLFVFLKPDKVTGHNEGDLKQGFQAQWLIFSADMDLALLRIVNPPPNLYVVPVAADSNVGVGEATAAIGHPEHGAKWSLTTGRIGGTWNDFDGVKGKDVYQMETSVNRGNSGGPLLDGNGYLIGINTSIARRSEDGLAITGINFAIQSNVVRRWIEGAKEQLAQAPDLAPGDPPAPSAVAKAVPPPPAEETVPAPGTPAREATTIALPLAAASPTLPATPAVPQTPAPAADAPETPAAPEAPEKPAAPARQPVGVPPPPPRAKSGFTSTEKPGVTLSGADLAKWHAKKAFDELDAEGAKRKR